MPTLGIFGNIFLMETRRGSGAVQGGTIGPGAILARVLQARVVLVTYVILLIVRKQLINNVPCSGTNGAFVI